jgi:phosphoribosylglycinamide formyltransferase-1
VRVGVCASGSGTNFQALLDARGPDFPEIAVLVCDRRAAGARERASRAGIPEVYLPAAGRSREEYDASLVAALRDHGVDVVALAGFMRLVTPILLDAFPWRVVNIHPSLLPAFPGLHAQQQAFDHGVRVAGATVHLVDTGCDTGPILVQGAVPVLPNDDATSLQQRILQVEHRIYPMALRMVTDGRVRVVGRRAIIDLLPGEQTWIWAS